MSMHPQIIGDLQQALQNATAMVAGVTGYSIRERHEFSKLRAEVQKLTEALETVQQHRRNIRMILEQVLHQVIVDESATAAKLVPTVTQVQQLLVQLGA